MEKTTKTVNKKSKASPEDSRGVPGYSSKYDYVLDWIKEATDSRRAQNAFVERAVMAYETKPSGNRYKGTISQYAKSVSTHDAERAKQIQKDLSDIPDKGSMVIQNAVETVVSMAQGGVGQYQFAPNDPDSSNNHRIMDRLGAAAKYFYSTNRVDSVLPQWIRNAALAGVGYAHVKQKNNKKVLTLLESSQMLTDPKRFKTNYERFIGFSQRESFQSIKSSVKKMKGGGYVLKTLNDAEVYVSQIKQELNSVLVSGGNSVTSSLDHEELRQDINMFYQPLITRLKEGREKDNPALMYDGDEVERSYVYDLVNDMYLEIINRKYIIVAKKNPLRRDIKITYYDDAGKEKTRTKEVRLDHPFIELPYNKLFWTTYPVSPLFYVLDDFDDLCAMESVLYHNLSIMAPITFVGQSSDTEKVSRVASVSGEVIEGLMQTFGVLNKSHDITPVITSIQRYEERIKRTMKAVDPFELQGMIGDRATAKEVVSASGQVAQGLNPFIANIETAMADLGDKFIKLELIMNDRKIYSFEQNGKYMEVTRDELATDCEITAKLVSKIKLEQEANSRKALELIQYLGQSEAVDKRQFLGTMIPIVLGDLVTREQAQNMILPAYKPMPDEIIAAIKKRAEEDAKKDEIDKLDLSEYGDEDLDKMAAQFGQMSAGQAPVTQPPQQLADPMTGAPMDPAQQPVFQQAIPAEQDAAGEVANDPMGQGYGV